MAIRCEKCGLDVKANDSFCSHCGAPISAQGRMQEIATNPDMPAKPSDAPKPVGVSPINVARTTGAATPFPGPTPAAQAPERVLWQEYPSMRTTIPPVVALVVLFAIAMGLVISLRPAAAEGRGQFWDALPWIVVAVFLLLIVGLLVKNAIRLYSVRYRLSTQRIFVDRGILNRRTDEVELEQYKDVYVNQTFFDKLVGCGDIKVLTGDETTQTVDIIDVIDPVGKKEMIRSAARERQQALGILRREEL